MDRLQRGFQEAENLPGTTPKELSRVERLLKKGKYRVALELVEKFAARQDLTVENRLAGLLLKGQLHKLFLKRYGSNIFA